MKREIRYLLLFKGIQQEKKIAGIHGMNLKLSMGPYLPLKCFLLKRLAVWIVIVVSLKR